MMPSVEVYSARIDALRGRMVPPGYPSDLYDRHLSSWHHVDFEIDN